MIIFESEENANEAVARISPSEGESACTQSS